MKKFFKKIAFVSALAMVISSMPAQNAKAEDDINMYPTLKMYLGADESDDFPGSRYAKVWGHREAGYTVKFASDNEEVATVTENKGLVTAKKVGTATVTATFSKEGAEDVVKTCKVTVKNHAVEAGVSDASKDKLQNLTVGETFTLKTYRTDANGVTSWKGKDVITDGARFASSDPNVFTVTKKGGFVKAVGEGEATLSVWAVQSEGATKADGKVVEYKATTAKKTYPVKVKNHDRVTLVTDKDSLAADGKSTTTVTFTLYKADGSIDKETRNVQVTFTATRGAMSFADVTLQDGVGKVTYTSPILTNDETALIQATVTGAGSDAQDLINLTARKEIKLVAVAGTGNEEVNTGALMVSATAVTADRVTLYFNKNVTPANFMDKDGKIDRSKFNFKLTDNVTNSPKVFTEWDVAYIIANGNDSRSLTFVLKDDIKLPDGTFKGVMTDNTKFEVEFVDHRWAAVQGKSSNYLTDAVNPKALRVEYVNLKTIKVVFSESISPETAAKQFAIDGSAFANGIAYTDERWGSVSGSLASVKRVDGSDRNVFELTLGKDKNGKQIYFPEGYHSVTIYNIQDQAGRTDVANTVASQVLDFYVPKNEQKPAIESVTVMSPEQFIVSFNCYLSESDAAVAAALIFNYKDKDGQWKDLKNGGSLNIVNPYVLTNITENGGNSKYLVEVSKDWTVALGASTAQNADKVDVKYTNYYNYDFAFTVAANALTNAANGKTNDKQEVAINDPIMKNVDAKAPEIVPNSIVEKEKGKVYTITFDEPVQISNVSVSGAAGQITPSTQQIYVPFTTVYVVRTAEDGKIETFPATIKEVNKLNTTVTFKVDGEVSLTAGKKYTLYVRNITDDIGNAANVLPYEFTTKADTSTPNKFEIKYVKADAAFDTTGVANLNTVAQDTTNAPDAIYVAFSSDFLKYGAEKTVLSNTNWTINGAALPAGTVIVANVVGAAEGVKGVTIILPNGTITDINKTVVTLADTVMNADNNQNLQGENRVVTPYVK